MFFTKIGEIYMLWHEINKNNTVSADFTEQEMLGISDAIMNKNLDILNKNISERLCYQWITEDLFSLYFGYSSFTFSDLTARKLKSAILDILKEDILEKSREIIKNQDEVNMSKVLRELQEVMITYDSHNIFPNKKI